MTFLAVIGRILLGVVNQPGARDVFSTIGKYALRQASAALIRHVQNQTRPTRRSMSRIS